MTLKSCAGAMLALLLPASAGAATCMARMTIQGDTPSFLLVIPVAPGQERDFSAHGFTEAPCAGWALDLARYKAEICDLAEGNEDVRTRAESVFGVSPVRMCEAVKAIVPDAGVSK